LLVIVLALCFGAGLAQGQRDAHAAKLTTSEIEKIVQLVSTDKTKTQFYCELAKIDEQISQAKTNSAFVERLEDRADDLEEKIGSEFVKFMDALDGAEENTAEGKELMAALDKLDALCPNN
jgi:transketolase